MVFVHLVAADVEPEVFEGRGYVIWLKSHKVSVDSTFSDTGNSVPSEVAVKHRLDRASLVRTHGATSTDRKSVTLFAIRGRCRSGSQWKNSLHL